MSSCESARGGRLASVQNQALLLGVHYAFSAERPMDAINILGLVAGSLTTVAFVPQVIKIWKTGSAEDISTIMFLLFSTGVLLWLLYGIMLGAIPVIIANSITLVLAIAVLVLKFRLRR